ncbi:MAG: LacI family DNA-binding transcriptional regulator [Anaerolineae bacterium]|nr:LacI family DNA-binding transcriptional regulator [Anaerolineae bacterium]
MPDVRRISIKDLAREAGVSYSTVSRALDPNPQVNQLISSEVRLRIQELAQARGYSPNALAQSLQARRTNSIGLVITSVSDPFFVDVVAGVEEMARASGISVFLAMSNNDPEQEIKVIETFNRRRVDGIIVAASRVGTEYTNRLEQIRIPVVLINNQAVGEYQNLYSVSIDDAYGARMAVTHLLALGHRRIGYIGVSNRPRSNERRFQSYYQTLSSAGIEIEPGWIAISEAMISEDFNGDIQVGRHKLPDLINARVTAIFCYCDTVAAGALIACRHMGITVPDQMSIVGFDDSILCQVLSPPLTTICQPKRQLGQIAMDMLLTLKAGGVVSNSVIQPTLIVRGSTAPPPP